MKFTAVFFDWGDTLAPLDPKNVPVLQEWTETMIRKLYHHCYRLAIISNTHRYQDAHWIRKELEKRGLLSYFECVISSAIYNMSKPDPEIFRKAYDFMQVDPEKVVMVGDNAHCDGGCEWFKSTYLKVKPFEQWDSRLYEILEEDFKSNRKLTNLFEFNIIKDEVITKLRHLSEPLLPGDRVVLGDKEVLVTSVERILTKAEILTAKDQFYRFKVQELQFNRDPINEIRF